MYILGRLLTGCQFLEAVFPTAMGIPVGVDEITWEHVQMHSFYFKGYIFILMNIWENHNEHIKPVTS